MEVMRNFATEERLSVKMKKALLEPVIDGSGFQERMPSRHGFVHKLLLGMVHCKSRATSGLPLMEIKLAKICIGGGLLQEALVLRNKRGFATGAKEVCSE